MLFEKPGVIRGVYGYSFGVHVWKVKVEYSLTYNYNKDANGLLVVGIMCGKKSKLIGPTVNYSDSKGSFEIFL